VALYRRAAEYWQIVLSAKTHSAVTYSGRVPCPAAGLIRGMPQGMIRRSKIGKAQGK
jgi:hypothetical protein